VDVTVYNKMTTFYHEIYLKPAHRIEKGRWSYWTIEEKGDTLNQKLDLN